MTATPHIGRPTTSIEATGIPDDAGRTDQWRALHLTLVDTPRLERVLLQVVEPWLAATVAAGAIDSWFLDRSGTRDREVQLRLRGASEPHVRELRARIEAHLQDDDSMNGQVYEASYDPDPVPYGGAAGMAAAMSYLVASSDATMTMIRETPSPAKRRRGAAELLLASAYAIGADWAGTVAWLRSYAYSRDATGGEPPARLAPARLAPARQAATTDYLRNEAEWRRFHDRVRATLPVPHTVAGGWFGQVSRVWTRLTQLHRGGRLSTPPEAVLQMLVAATHRQLGLEPDDEAYVAWLLSMVLVSPGPREPFFADAAAAVDRQLHEQSKYWPTQLEYQRPDLVGATSQGRQPVGPVLRTIPLARPSGPAPGAPTLDVVLVARRSAYGSYHGPLSRDDLGTLLYYAAAETAEKAVPGTEAVLRVRPYPSGGARYPLRLLLYCHDVAGLSRGTYLYRPENHELDQLTEGDQVAELCQISPATDPAVEVPPKAGGNLDVQACPLWVFVVADLTYQRMHYGLRSYRLVLQESGHLAQNLSLVTTWLGKSSVGLGGFYDDVANQALHLDGVTSAVVYTYLIGVADPPA